MADRWLQLGNGLPFDFGVVPDLDLFTIADQLSKLCRFRGATAPGVFYSVAQHSDLVSHLVGPDPHLKMRALLHDAREIVTGDMASPLKKNMPDEFLAWWESVETTAQKQIEQALFVTELGYTREQIAAIKHADLVALATEKRDLLLPCPREWSTLPPPIPARIEPLDVDQAREAFVLRFNEIQRELERCPAKV